MSRLQEEKHSSELKGFVEALEITKEIIKNELIDAIQNGTIVIERGNEKLFEIIDNVGRLK